MHGPKVELADLERTFIPRRDGGIFSGPGRVDYSTGAIAPGVFAVVYSDNPRVRKDMKFITRAEGPYYLHFRPYHLCDIETPQSIAEAVLLGERTVTAEAMCAEVVCVAKRALRAGEKVGGLGSADIYGRIYRICRGLPIAGHSARFGAGGNRPGPNLGRRDHDHPQLRTRSQHVDLPIAPGAGCLAAGRLGEAVWRIMSKYPRP